MFFFLFFSVGHAILIHQMVIGTHAIIVVRRAIPLQIVQRRSGKNHALYVGSLGMVPRIAHRYDVHTT